MASDKSNSRKSQLNLAKAISITFFTILITFLISNIVIGGDALSGKMEYNRYFVWDAIHKTDIRGDKLYLEVSKYTYYFSLIITYLCLFLMPFFLFFTIKEFILNRKKKSY